MTSPTQKGEREEALGACPFDDGSREHRRKIRSNEGDGCGPPDAWWVQCSCGAEGPNARSAGEAAPAWNRRALLSSSKAEGEMREAADAVCGELEKWLPTLSTHRSRQDCNYIRHVLANYRALSPKAPT